MDGIVVNRLTGVDYADDVTMYSAVPMSKPESQGISGWTLIMALALTASLFASFSALAVVLARGSPFTALFGVVNGPPSDTILTTINSNGSTVCGLREALVNATFLGDGRTRVGQCLAIPSNFSLPIINPSANFTCPPGYSQKCNGFDSYGICYFPYCEQIVLSGVVVGPINATTLVNINVGSLGCLFSEALVGTTLFQDGRIQGGHCESVSGNGTLPDINNGTLNCTTGFVAVGRAVTGSGLTTQQLQCMADHNSGVVQGPFNDSSLVTINTGGILACSPGQALENATIFADGRVLGGVCVNSSLPIINTLTGPCGATQQLRGIVQPTGLVSNISCQDIPGLLTQVNPTSLTCGPGFYMNTTVGTTGLGTNLSCVALPPASLPTINVGTLSPCPTGFEIVATILPNGTVLNPSCVAIATGGVLAGDISNSSLVSINGGVVTCTASQALANATIFMDGRVFGGVCVALGSLANITTELDCGPSDVITGQTRTANGLSTGGMCNPLPVGNGSLPDINNGSTTCTGPATTITVPTTILGTGLSYQPYCLTVLTNTSTAGGGANGVFSNLTLNIIGTPNQATITQYANGTMQVGTPTAFIAPGTIQDTSGMLYSTNAAVVAQGSTQGTATPLTKSYNVLTTVANSSVGVVLPVVTTAGLRVVIVNKGAATSNIYPALGAAIDGAGANAAVTLAVGGTVTYEAASTTQWYTVDPPMVAGTGITITYGNGLTQITNSIPAGVATLTGTPNQVAASASTGAVTLSTPAIFIAPGTIQDTTGMLYSTNAAVVAQGSTQATATVLTKSFNVLTTVANSSVGVVLPVVTTAGLRIVLVNKGAATVNVYPAANAAIDGAAANASVTLDVGGSVTYEAASTSQWYTVDRPVVAGTGITVTYANGKTTVAAAAGSSVTSLTGTPNQVAASASTGAVTLSTPAVFIAPGTIQDTSGMLYSTNAAVSAGGSSQSDSTNLTKSYNVVTVVGSNTGVKLPLSPTAGYIVVVVNKGGANTLNIYPASGAAIDGSSTNVAVTLTVNAAATYQAASATQWYTVNVPVSASTGLSITRLGGFQQLTNTGVTSITGQANQVSASASTGAITLSTPAVFIAPGTIQDTAGMLYSTNAAVTASGASQGTSTALTKSYNVIISTSTGTGVELPVLPTAGFRVVVVNKATAIVNVFPSSASGGGTIDNAATNAAVQLPINATATYEAASSTQWYTVNPPVVAGTGVTVTYGNGQTSVALSSSGAVTSISGTPNQVTANASTGAVTLSTPATFIGPGTIQDTTGMLFSTTTGISANGTTQGTAVILTTSYNVIMSVGNLSNNGVKLPLNPTPGFIVVVVNQGVNTLNVYPAFGAMIDAAEGANLAVIIPSRTSAIYQAATTNQWYTVAIPVVAGTGISISYDIGQSTLTNTGVTSAIGTPNQVAVSGAIGAVTISTPTTFIAPGTIQDTSGMIYSTNGSVTATGTTQGTAAILSKSYNVITSTSSGNTGVKLPVSPTPGLRIVVANFGDRTMTVFPGTSGFIDNGGINGGVSLPLNAIATYQAFSATQWLTVNPPIVAGNSINVAYLNGQTQVSFPSSPSLGTVTTSVGVILPTTGGTAATLDYNDNPTIGTLSTSLAFVGTNNVNYKITRTGKQVVFQATGISAALSGTFLRISAIPSQYWAASATFPNILFSIPITDNGVRNTGTLNINMANGLSTVSPIAGFGFSAGTGGYDTFSVSWNAA